MSFYIRKSVSVGPFRFNLSKSGIGMSTGVKGFRIGSGPSGNYIHMGRGGLYYRTSLSPKKNRAPAIGAASPQHETLPLETQGNVIETGDVSAMIPAKAEEILNQINDKLTSKKIWPFVAALGIAATYMISSQIGIQSYVNATAAITFLLAAVCAYYESIHRKVVLMYDLDSESENIFCNFCEQFRSISDSRKAWNINTKQNAGDKKYSAGASALVSRSDASLEFSVPSIIKTNIDIPCIKGGKQSLYFFPDIILVIEKNQVGAIPYNELSIEWATTTFIEESGVPEDSEILGHTWKYMNKSGGPDRRFKDNTQIPQVQYQQMTLQSQSGFNKVLHLSKVSDRSDFTAAIQQMRVAMPSIVSA